MVGKSTLILAAAIKRLGLSIGIDIGTPIKNDDCGDSIWFILTDGDDKNTTSNSAFVLIITPHVILLESVYGPTESMQIHYSIIDSALPFLEHLSNSGVRKLNDEELNEFLLPSC